MANVIQNKNIIQQIFHGTKIGYDWTSHLYITYNITEEKYIWIYSEYTTKQTFHMNHRHKYHTATLAKKHFKVHHLSLYNYTNMYRQLHIQVHTDAHTHTYIQKYWQTFMTKNEF